MRGRTRILITLSVTLLLGFCAAAYLGREKLIRQWACYRVGAADSYDQARSEIAWFEQGPKRRQRLEELVAKWGTGNPRFDRYLARYVSDPASSEELRKRFSLELGWRDVLLARWAHFWRWQAKREPDEEIASVVRYLNTLVEVDPPRELTWREVLDLQAVLTLTGHPDMAHRLDPTSWQARYRRWEQIRPDPLPPIPRPEEPFNGP